MDTDTRRRLLLLEARERADYAALHLRERARRLGKRLIILVVGTGFYAALQLTTYELLQLLHPEDLEAQGYATVTVVGGALWIVRWMYRRIKVFRALEAAADQRRD